MLTKKHFFSRCIILLSNVQCLSDWWLSCWFFWPHLVPETQKNWILDWDGKHLQTAFIWFFSPENPFTLIKFFFQNPIIAELSDLVLCDLLYVNSSNCQLGFLTGIMAHRNYLSGCLLKSPKNGPLLMPFQSHRRSQFIHTIDGSVHWASFPQETPVKKGHKLQQSQEVGYIITPIWELSKLGQRLSYLTKLT